MAAECTTERADRLLLMEKLKANIPPELQKRRQFCARARKRPFVKKAGVEELTASWKPGTKTEWLTFDQAIEVVEQGMVLADEADQDCQVSGIGFLTARTDPQIVGGDLDRCRDPETGLITPFAVQVLNGLRPFYTEISPSSCGLRFFCYGDLPNEVNSVEGVGPNDVPHDTWERILEIKPDSDQPNELELYTNDRHLSLTGDKLDEYCFEQPARTFDFAVVEPWVDSKIEPSKNELEAKSQADPVEQTTACKPSHQVEIGKSIDGWKLYTPDQKAHYCRQALQSAVEVVRCASVGKRNITLNDQAFAMGTLVPFQVEFYAE
jgi:hypothetical protein